MDSYIIFYKVSGITESLKMALKGLGTYRLNLLFPPSLVWTFRMAALNTMGAQSIYTELHQLSQRGNLLFCTRKLDDYSIKVVMFAGFN